MMAPFGAAEKQALLEAPDLKTRAETLIAITEMALARDGDPGGGTFSRRSRWPSHVRSRLTDPKLLELLVCPLTKGGARI